MWRILGTDLCIELLGRQQRYNGIHEVGLAPRRELVERCHAEGVLAADIDRGVGSMPLHLLQKTGRKRTGDGI